MTTQTKRQTAISPNMRIGIHKNCGSVRRRGIAKTFGIKVVPLDRTAKLLSERNSSLIAPLNAPNKSGGSNHSFCAADQAGTVPMGFDIQQRMAPQCASDLRHRGAQNVHPTHPMPSEELTAPQMRRIFRTAYRITRNREDAEDAIQDAYLQAFTHFQDFDGRSKFSTWLTKIAINSSLMILRKRRNARTVSLDNAADSEESKGFQEIGDPAPGAEKRYLQKERETALRNEINALRPTLRGVIELAQLGEWSVRETAEMLGLSVAAVKARLFHARRTLSNSRRLRPFRKDQPPQNTLLVRALCPKAQQSS